MTSLTPFTDHEIQQFRNDTRGTASVIHFNNAGSSLPVNAIVDTVTTYLQNEAVQGGYEAEATHAAALDTVYTLVARLINAEKDEIALTENASMSWAIAFGGISFEPGDEVLTSELEYVTNLLYLIHARQTKGIVFKVIPNDEQGNFSLAELEASITTKTKLMAVTHMASTTGGVLPVAAIGRIARKHGILYLVDACQTAGQAPIDVHEMQCDFLAATGRKYLRAPRGTGFLYVRKAVQQQLQPVLMDGHSILSVTENGFQFRDDAKRFELYENNRALLLGLGAAVAYALNIGVPRIWQRIQYLANILRGELQQIPGVRLHDHGSTLCGIVTFTVEGKEVELVKQQLAAKKINVSVGLAKSTLLYMNKHQLPGNIRASIHYYNTEAEIAVCCEALREIVRQ